MAGKNGVSINWGGMDKALNGIAARMANRRKLMQAIGEVLVSGTQKRFIDETAPDGTPWKPTRRGGKILTDTARLQRSIDSAATDDSVMVGSNLVYAAPHQMGATITPKKAKRLKFKTPDGGFASVSQVTIPARPFLGVSEEDKEEIAATIGEFMRGAVKG